MSVRSSPGYARPLLSWTSDFLVEKLDLFLELAAPSSRERTLSFTSRRIGNVAEQALIIVGASMVAIAAARFLMTAKAIDSEERRQGPGCEPIASPRSRRAVHVVADRGTNFPTALAKPSFALLSVTALA